jgi:hypothetical protein
LDCQRYLDRQQDFFLIDTDRSNATTSSYYGRYKYERSASFSEAVERASTANSLLDAALLRPVVANCRAGSNEALLTWLVSKKVPMTARRLGIKLRYLFVSDLENDSLNLFEPTVKAMGEHMPVIFVANLGRNTTDLQFFESAGFQGLLSEYGVPVVRLGLFDLEMKKVIDGRNEQRQLLTWGEARDYPDFGILGQQEIQTYLEDFYAQLDGAEGLADLAFSQRTSSKSDSGAKGDSVPPAARKRNSANG